MNLNYLTLREKYQLKAKIKVIIGSTWTNLYKRNEIAILFIAH